MSDFFKVFNNIKDLYEQEYTKNDQGKFVCPVCGKVYKTEKAIQKHMNRQDCFTYLSLLKDTMTEVKVYTLYKNLVEAFNPKARVSFTRFRKSKQYKPCARFILFCHSNEVKEIETYIEWLSWSKNCSNMSSILSTGVKETVLREFRIHQQVTEDIKSQTFYERYKDDLKTDAHFLTRSIEKSHISVTYLATKEDFNFEETLQNLPVDYQQRIESLIQQIIESRNNG